MPALRPLIPLLGLLLAGAAAAHEPAPPPPVPYPAAAAHAPRPLPDRIVLTWSGDPATTQDVTWRTDTSVSGALAEIARAADSATQLRAAAVPAATMRFDSDLGPAHYHTARFTGLAPDTLHAYRVGDGVNWSEWFHFRTASREPRPFTFIYFGDAQNDIRTHWSRVFREAFRDAPRAAFTLHAGDLIDSGHRDAQWGEWFGAPAWVNATIPVVPTPGNHEYARRDPKDTTSPRALSPHWRPQFSLPAHGPAGLEETCYYLDYQGARIISLNSNERLADQVPWLRAALRDNPQRWTIVTFHHPVFAAARERDNAALRDAWKPLFDEFRVDLVLTGHDHSYARSGLPAVTGTENVPQGVRQAFDPAVGTVYVVSVSGPKQYDITNETWWVRAAEDTQLYQLVTVDGDSLAYEARTATGRLYDRFALHKRAAGPNELVESPAGLPPERRRPASRAP